MGGERSSQLKDNLWVFPYGPLAEKVQWNNHQNLRMAKTAAASTGKESSKSRLLLTSARAMGVKFPLFFRRHFSRHTRLLVINDTWETDTLFARLLSLNIRSPERCYVADIRESERAAIVLMEVLLGRMCSAVAAHECHVRILDARLENDALHVINPNFKRLEVPVAKIPCLNEASQADVRNFEIDPDGSYLYWPKQDVHLGWEQLEQVVDPESVRKVQRKSRAFNVRYGAAIKLTREAAGLSLKNIPGLSDKQVRRIERGQCRSTTQALRKLASAHGWETNAYLQKVAETMTP